MTQVLGVQEMLKAFQQLQEEVQSAVDRGLRTTATRLTEMAKDLAPVNTGNLRDSINWEEVENEILVDVRAAYAGAVEFGTNDANARPFFFPSVDVYRKEIANIIAQEVKKV